MKMQAIWVTLTAFCFGAELTLAQPAHLGRIVIDANSVQLFREPLSQNALGVFSRGDMTQVRLRRDADGGGQVFAVLDDVQVPTPLGLQAFLKVEQVADYQTPFGQASASLSALQGWCAVSTADLKRIREAKESTPVRITPDQPSVRSDPFLLTVLFVLPFAGFAGGIYLRNNVFNKTPWRPVGQQVLIAVPIALLTVSPQILAALTLISKCRFELAPSLAVFLTMIGITTIQGVLLPELSWRYIEYPILSKKRVGRQKMRRPKAARISAA